MNEQDLQNSSEGENTTSPVQPEETEAAVAAVEETTDVAETAADEVIEAATEAPEAVVEAAEEVVADIATTTETVVEPVVAGAAAVPFVTKVKEFVSAKRYTIAAIALVLVGLLGLVYLMEAQGKLNTNFFGGVQTYLSKYQAAATVNGEKISEHDLGISMGQLAAGAAAQGLDIEDPATKAELRTQALDMLVNTELLRQEAIARGIEIPEADITARLDTLKEDVGGEEVLKERMAQFNIDEKTLLRDIKNELTIQALLEQIFAEKEVAVTEAEVAEFYEQAGGAEAGLPELAEVKAQIETQLKTSKEQQVVTTFLEELRGKATIETSA